MDGEAALVQHCAGDVRGEEAHTHEGDADVHVRIFVLDCGREALFGCGQRQARNVKRADGGDEDIALWIDLQGIGLVKFAPDVELQYVVGAGDICVRVYIAILTDARLVRA